METTKLSSQGQVTVPQSLREQWEEGQELILINIGDGVLVKPKKLFSETRLDELAGCLNYQGNWTVGSLWMPDKVIWTVGSL